MMNFNKSQQFYRLNYFRFLQQSSYTPPRIFVHYNLRNTTYRILPAHVPRNLYFSCATLLNTSIKAMGEDCKRSFDVNIKDIMQAQNDNNVLIIDVREKDEINETGKLPGSINIPTGEVANTLLNLSNEDFENKFDRKKPTKDTKIILSCRSGRRSKMVQEEIQKLGYKNVYNYSGGWLDWDSNQ